MAILNQLKAGFALAVPASQEVLKKIAAGILVHKVRVNIARDHVIKSVIKDPTGFANCQVRMTGETGSGAGHLLRSTIRDHRILDFDLTNLFQGAAGRGFTDYVYFFLGEPEGWQEAAQNYGGDGEFLTIRVKGSDLLADKRRQIFYRRGLFWEADKAVVVKGGYEGPAKVSPLPSDLSVPVT